MTKTCNHCSASFQITDDDLQFYDRISPVFNNKKYDIPPPTFCPGCRMQRRMTWRNERNLYHRKSDLSGKQIISMYAPDTPYVVYEQDEWWSDKWDAKDYGRDFDFNRSFAEQFADLLQVVPRINLLNVNRENSEYCNFTGDVKNSYLIFGSVYSEDCYYGSPYYSKNCIDTLVVRECEWCYECTDCRKLYSCLFCQDCVNSSDLFFCYDLQGCGDCICCAGLRNKKYCIYNKQYSKAEYQKMKQELNLCNPRVRKELHKKLEELKRNIPHRYMQSNQVENVSGNYIYQSKNVQHSFYTDRSEDCAYCAQVVDMKNSYDCNYTEEGEMCYEYLGMYQTQSAFFSSFSRHAYNTFYCDHSIDSQYLFGCVGMRNSKYCILNKQYSQEEYEQLVPKIIEHMRRPAPSGAGQKIPLNPPLRKGEVPLFFKEGLGEISEWGEFLPTSISPFAYNETVASEYFPLSKEQVRAQGWQWREEEEKDKNYLGPKVDIPDNIADVDDAICEQILICEVTGKPYKIIPQELKFYRRMGIPLPRKSPNQRHRERMALRNPRTLFQRECEQCGEAIQTTYALERPEKVYCERCYLESMY